MTKIVIFQGTSQSFSCGADVHTLVKMHSEQPLKDANDFLDGVTQLQYTLGYQLALMNPIQVSIWNGFVMGGGAGISINSALIVATERAIFAVPACKLGMVPDCGVMHKLSMCRNGVGEYICLVGTFVKGGDLVKMGLADFFLSEEDLKAKITCAFCKLDGKSTITTMRQFFEENCFSMINRDYNEIEEIKYYFNNKKSVVEILELLEKDKKYPEFTEKCLKEMRQASPLALCIAFESLRRSRVSLRDVITKDYRILNRLGISSVIAYVIILGY